MAPQITSLVTFEKKCKDSSHIEGNTMKSIPFHFGSFICDGKYRKKDYLFTATGLLSKIYFGDAPLFKRNDNMPNTIGCTLEDMKAALSNPCGSWNYLFI
jgi:hypothetical protein